MSESEKPVVAPCIVWLSQSNGLPDSIILNTSHKEGDFSVSEEAVLMLEDPTFDQDRSYNFANPLAKLIGTESYVTPSGIEVKIVASQAAYREDSVCTEYKAQFVLNRASFCVGISVDEGESCEDALALLKEVLDAYK